MAVKKGGLGKGLGKGLDALIPESSARKNAKTEVEKQVVIEKVIKKEEVRVKFQRLNRIEISQEKILMKMLF